MFICNVYNNNGIKKTIYYVETVFRYNAEAAKDRRFKSEIDNRYILEIILKTCED
jgi:hypothetical protein